MTVHMRQSSTALREIGDHGEPRSTVVDGANNPRRIVIVVCGRPTGEKRDVRMKWINLDDIVVPTLLPANVRGRCPGPVCATVRAEIDAEVGTGEGRGIGDGGVE